MSYSSPWHVDLAHRLVAHPAVYDAVQYLFGLPRARRQLRPILQDTFGTVLDVGAGTGNYAGLLPPHSQYFWLDNDPLKLRGFRKKYPSALAVLADGTCACIRDKSVDFALCTSVSHHFDDRGFTALLENLARVCREGLIFVDAVDRPDSLASRLLWKYDVGSFPRKRDVLRALIETRFRIVYEKRYRTFHDYLICVAKPR